jgi:hypothetical protein
MKSGELGFEGVDLELVDATGKVAGTARTDFDGFFLFERVPYGRYTLRVSAASAAAAKIGSDIASKVDVSADHSVVRLGSLQPQAPARIAAAAIAPATP